MTLVDRVILGPTHQPTGRTRHYVVGDPQLPNPHQLEIRHDGSGFFLIHLDDSCTEIADTWHLTVDDALHQAEFEFQIRPEDWTMINDVVVLSIYCPKCGQPVDVSYLRTDDYQTSSETCPYHGCGHVHQMEFRGSVVRAIARYESPKDKQ